MKISLKKNILVLYKIIIPSIICVALIYFFKVYIDFQFILTFGLVIIIFNKEKTKHNFILCLLYSIILCFLVLFLSMGIHSGFTYFIKNLLMIDLKRNPILGDILALIPISIISPILMCYSYSLLFNIEKTKYFFIIKWISVFILIVLGLTKILFEKDRYFMSWQFVMALALQLILYQKELIALFKPKNR